MCFFSFGADAADGFSVFSTGATAHTGETVTISIKNTEASLGSYSVYVNYDKTKLQYKSSSLGDVGSALPQAHAHISKVILRCDMPVQPPLRTMCR